MTVGRRTTAGDNAIVRCGCRTSGPRRIWAGTRPPGLARIRDTMAGSMLGAACLKLASRGEGCVLRVPRVHDGRGL